MSPSPSSFVYLGHPAVASGSTLQIKFTALNPHSGAFLCLSVGPQVRNEPIIPSRLLVLGESFGLRAQVGGSRARLAKVSAEHGLHEGSEDDLSAAGKSRQFAGSGGKKETVRGERNIPEHRQSEPQEENKLEGVVEGEPVDNTKNALEDSEEREDNPVLRAKN